MSGERPQSPEQSETLNQLLAQSDIFLQSCEFQPGPAYRPITIPLSGLVSKTGEAKVIGYRPDEFYHYLSPDCLSEALKEIDMLRVYGLHRGRHLAQVPVNNWTGTISLTELRAVRLVRRQLEPNGSERVFELSVRVFDGSGDTTHPYEAFVYSSERGLLEHSQTDFMAHKLASQK